MLGCAVTDSLIGRMETAEMDPAVVSAWEGRRLERGGRDGGFGGMRLVGGRKKLGGWDEMDRWSGTVGSVG